MSTKQKNKAKKNPYIENFLKDRKMWSTTSACHGEEAWDAAIETVVTTLKERRFNVSTTAFKAIESLKSTKQRGY